MNASLTPQQKLFLQHIALQLRIDSIRATTKSASGHPTSCLSAADIVASLFFHAMRYRADDPSYPNNDRLIMSKGHAIPVIYAAWKQVDVISDDELLSLRSFDSPLEGHPTPRFPYNEAATGSLGQGLSIGLGMAINARLRNLSYNTYVLMGDGEIAEGSVWEAAELAAHRNVSNLIGIVDVNRLGQSEPTLDEHHVNRIAGKFAAFGWKTYTINGHDIEEIISTLNAVTRDKQPVVIVAQTLKGYGLSGIEDENGFHGKPFKDKDAQRAIASLRTRFADAAEYKQTHPFTPALPDQAPPASTPKSISLDLTTDPQNSLFIADASIATRKAFGYGLAALGRQSSDVVALDGDVKNSTYTEIFEQEHNARFIQCYIAEQNMVGVATGLELRGYIPFAATFAAFFSRAHDQIRMAGIGRNALRLCGSHAGVSIGEDGPSQMGLEDLGIMRAVPNSIVLYPSDGVTAYKLCEIMANYHDGISYMRTTRMNTPILYDTTTPVRIGGSHVHAAKNPRACIIAAGITVHEALAAQHELHKQEIPVTVIDAYSIKPLDTKKIIHEAERAGRLVLTVEDHYKEGGLYEAVCGELVNTDIAVHGRYVDHVSRSGKPAQLLADAGIDAPHIIDTIHSLLA